MPRAVIINLTDEEMKKLGELVDMEIEYDEDVEYAVKVLIENL